MLNRYQDTSLSEKGFISQVRIKFVLIIHAHYHLRNGISLNFLYLQKMICQKVKILKLICTENDSSHVKVLKQIELWPDLTGSCGS